MSDLQRFDLGEVANYEGGDPRLEPGMVEADDGIYVYASEAQSQLAALREELAQTKRTAITEILALNSTLNNQAKELAQHDSFEELYNTAIDERDAIQQRLADAERRNSELRSVLERMLEDDDMPVHWFAQRIDAALNPNQEAASHDE